MERHYFFVTGNEPRIKMQMFVSAEPCDDYEEPQEFKFPFDLRIQHDQCGFQHETSFSVARRLCQQPGLDRAGIASLVYDNTENVLKVRVTGAQHEASLLLRHRAEEQQTPEVDPFASALDHAAKVERTIMGAWEGWSVATPALSV